MLIDKIANNNKFLKINPMEKFFFSIGLLLIMLISDKILFHVINSVIIILFLIFLVKISFRELAELYKVPVSFIVLSNISFALTGENYILLTAKAINSISIVYFLFCITPITQVAYIMKKLKFPSIIIELFLLIYRFIFLFTEIKNQFLISQKSRLGFINRKASYNSIGLIGSNMFFKVLKYAEYANISVKSRLGEDFLFWEETYESSKNFRYLFFYLIIVILGVVYDKI